MNNRLVIKPKKKLSEKQLKAIAIQKKTFQLGEDKRDDLTHSQAANAQRILNYKHKQMKHRGL